MHGKIGLLDFRNVSAYGVEILFVVVLSYSVIGSASEFGKGLFQRPVAGWELGLEATSRGYLV